MPAARKNQSKGESQVALRRLDRGLSQQKLAELAGLDLRTLQRIERKEAPEPRLRPFVRLARVLQCPIEDLLEPEMRHEPLVKRSGLDEQQPDVTPPSLT